MIKFIVPNIPFVPDRIKNAQDSSVKIISTNLANIPIVNGSLITGIDGSDGITLTAATNTIVYHNLGRQYKGWFVVREFGSNVSSIRESTTQPSNTDRAISLISGTTCKVYLWIF